MEGWMDGWMEGGREKAEVKNREEQVRRDGRREEIVSLTTQLTLLADAELR